MPSKKAASPAVTRRATRRGSSSRSLAATGEPTTRNTKPNELVKDNPASNSSSRERNITRKHSTRAASASGDFNATTSPAPSTGGRIVNACNTKNKVLGGWSSHKSKQVSKARENGGSTGMDDASAKAETEEPVGAAAKNGRVTRRKRKAQEQEEESVVDTAVSEPMSPRDLHIVKRGIQIKVRIIIENGPYSPSQDSTSSTVASPKFLGNDGNQYYCQVCRGFGDVVCCDGCPKVFHPNCVPIGTTSRHVLDTDQEPWYCPLCTNEATSIMSPQDSLKTPRAPSRCADCQKLRHGFDLLPCTECGKVIHSPSCIPSKNHSTTLTEEPLCRACRGECQEDDVEKEQDEGIETQHHQDNSQEGYMAETESAVPASASKKKRNRDEPTSEDKRKKKKKKKRRHSNASLSNDGTATTARSTEVSEEPVEEEVIPRPVPSQSAFLFYIAENRWKVEKALTKGHRTFNRLPKGNERNAIVVQEAFQWWNELSDDEKRPFVNMAVKDFEQKLLIWKEEKEVTEYHPTLPPVERPEGESNRSSDARHVIQQYDRLYQKTSVGSRLFKPESDQSHNRVLLDLLYDTRFHPLPLFASTRNEVDLLKDREASLTKASIPFFDVHGPVSTSIGDECMGCTRGWNHQCPVLKQRMPFIEYRARLQAPVSALVASRIGLGFRPAHSPNESKPDLAPLFSWRSSDLGQQLDALEKHRGYSLSKPSERTDEIVRFIEEAAIMKVPEPTHPLDEDISSDDLTDRGAYIPRSAPTFQKCGRCRAIIVNKTGCVQCRRASLVIDKSKYPLSCGHEEMDRHKINTAMLSRVQNPGKEENIKLRRFDPRVGEAILQMKWCPSCILPERPVINSEKSIVDDATTSSGSEVSEMDSVEVLHSDNRCTPSVDPGSKISDGEIAAPIEADFVGDIVATKPIAEANVDDELMESTEEKSCESELDNNLAQNKRTRSTRIQSAKRESNVSLQRDEFVENHKKEAKEVTKKAVQTACYCLFSALLRRDPLHLFARPVDTEEYIKFIKNPIDFGLMRQNLLDGKYTTLGSFCSDCRLLCENALAFNPPSSVYYKTAEEMHKLIGVMQKRASDWIGAIKDAHEGFVLRMSSKKRNQDTCDDSKLLCEHPLDELKAKWPDAVHLLERSDFYRQKVESDFMRTRENELAYYGTIVVQRTAVAAEVSMAPYPESDGKFAVVPFRNHVDDEALRQRIDESVASIKQPELRNVSTWREEAVVRLVRKVQNARLDRKTVSENGCSRCDLVDKAKLQPRFAKPAKAKKKDSDDNRTHPTRKMLTTGLASEKVANQLQASLDETYEGVVPSVISTSVAVRGSKTHGMGLYAEQTFKAGDLVAEYVGEYVVSHIADEREKLYRRQRIQDYQFRLNDQLVIDATKKGGPARYINHSCSPNCKAKIVPGSEIEELRRVLIVAQRDININEEISYDYQFPLELDLSARVPCNCGSESCRGFMNWDLPEKGSNCRVLLVQKRGTNMRDRIRRLGRPLKRDE